MFLSGCCICDADIGFSSAFTTPLTIRDSQFKDTTKKWNTEE